MCIRSGDEASGRSVSVVRRFAADEIGLFVGKALCTVRDLTVGRSPAEKKGQPAGGTPSGPGEKLYHSAAPCGPAVMSWW